jgi:hypothetical protein
VPQSSLLEKVVRSVLETGKTVTIAVKSEPARRDEEAEMTAEEFLEEF